jgi:hypothetical protein
MTDRQAIEAVPADERAAVLRPLLAGLAAGDFPPEAQWDGWQMRAVRGGRNGLVYHATGPAGDLALKFMARDGRRRAEREYGALMALREAGLSLAPAPLLLDPDTYPLEACVASWLPGEVSLAPPAGDGEWLRLIEHLCLVHSVTPERVSVQLPEAVLTACSPSAARRLVRDQAGHLPTEVWTAEADGLLERLEQARWPDWPPPQPVLCRCDANTLNYIRRRERWLSVDWENSGWGDPAFEVAELTLHPALAQVEEERWQWVIEAFSQRSADPKLSGQVRVYRQALAVWWVFRALRYQHDAQTGGDRRPAQRRAGWDAGQPDLYAHYLALASRLLTCS